MNFELFIARKMIFGKKNVQFLPFIRLLAIVGLSVGTIALTLTAGILNGFEKNLIEKITGFDAHIRILNISGDMFRDSEDLRVKIESNSDIKLYAPYLNFESIIKIRENTEGVLVEAMNQTDFDIIHLPSKKCNAGTLDYGNDGIILGAGVARNLNISVGDTVDVMVLKRSGSIFDYMHSTAYAVRGIFSTGMSEYDENLAYMSLEAANHLLKVMDRISGYQLILNDPALTEKAAAWCDESLSYPYFFMTWQERHRTLFRWLDTQKLPILIIFGLISLVAIVNIISTLVMIVIVKEKEIAILKSMGLSPVRIKKMFFFDGLFIGSIGIFIGIVIAKFLEWGQMRYAWIKISADVYFIDRIPIDISWTVMGIIIAVGLLLAVLSSLYPAAKAASVKPAELLRYE